MIPLPTANTIARPYRGLSVQRVAPPSHLDELADHVLARQVYRRTALLLARWDEGAALLGVRPAPGDGLFRDVAEARLLARPDELVWIDDPDVDVGNATALPPRRPGTAPTGCRPTWCTAATPTSTSSGGPTR
nr:hypothetical protein [Pseudonocardia nigra]